MSRSTHTRLFAIVLMLVAGAAAAQPPVRAFANHAFAGKPRVFSAQALPKPPPPGVEQVAVPTSYWKATANAEVTYTRELSGSTPTLREVNHLPQRQDIKQAVLAPIERDRMRVTASLSEGQLWITQGKQAVSVPLEIRGGVNPTHAHLQTLGKVGKAISTEQARTWRLPDAIILDLENNASYFRMGNDYYQLKLDKIQGTFELKYPSSTVTERPNGLLFVAYR